MGRGRELDPQLRSRICELKSYGLSYTRIHRLHPEIPLGTIRTTCRREKERLNNHSQPRSGRPHKITEVQRDQLYEAISDDPTLKNRQLLDVVDHTVKKRALQRLLRELGRRKWLQRKRPHLTEDHARARLAWAETYRHYNEEDWKRVKWTDECTVERGVGIRPVWSFLRPSEQIKQQAVGTRRASGKGVKKMLWAGFGHNIRTPLVPLDGDPEAARGGVTARVIRQLYYWFLPGFVADGDIFMHDNASVHTAHIVRDILRAMRINVMIWPPYSPDLNPIENLWALMKAEIYKLYPELETAPDTDETLALLIQAAQDAWGAIDQAVLDNLSKTMPKRVQAVIDAEGWYTKY